jgi:predicted AlkP superfamily pyrophosphatase or phosphodiesterase
MVSLDGLMPACYLQADELGLAIPNLRRLMARGAWARGVVGVLPTVTYPSHTTLMTGVPPRTHGVDSNKIFDPEGRSNGSWHFYASAIRVPTLVSAARARWMTTATVSWPVSVGIGSDVNLPEFWRPGSDHPVDRKLLALLSSPPGLLDAAGALAGRAIGFPLTDEDRTDVAVFALRTYRPHLALVHIFELDSAQHDHGPMSPEAKAALEKSDALLGRLLAALEEAGTAQRTLVAVVSDHGFLPTTRYLKPNALLREAGLLAVGEKGRIREWKACFQTDGGTAALHLRDPRDAALAARVRALFEPKLRDPESGLRALLGPPEIERMGGADVPLVLNAREGFSFSDGAEGEWFAPLRSKGYHGHAPDRDEMLASLILAGPGLRAKGDLGVVRMTSIAPTLARFLGLTLAPEADSPLPVLAEP